MSIQSAGDVLVDFIEEPSISIDDDELFCWIRDGAGEEGESEDDVLPDDERPFVERVVAVPEGRGESGSSLRVELVGEHLDFVEVRGRWVRMMARREEGLNRNETQRVSAEILFRLEQEIMIRLTFSNTDISFTTTVLSSSDKHPTSPISNSTSSNSR